MTEQKNELLTNLGFVSLILHVLIFNVENVTEFSWIRYNSYLDECIKKYPSRIIDVGALSFRRMNTIIQSILIVVFILEFITGSLVNGFIALVNCMGWVKRRNLSLVDRFLTALTVSRITVLFVVLLNCWLYINKSALLISRNIFKIILIAKNMNSYFSIWLATTFSSFYILKIANFPTFFFITWSRDLKLWVQI